MIYYDLIKIFMYRKIYDFSNYRQYFVNNYNQYPKYYATI